MRKQTNKSKERKAKKLLKTGMVSSVPGRVYSCYVCKGAIKQYPVYIGQDLYRHEKCCPGSARWMLSARAQVSELTEFFGSETTK